MTITIRRVEPSDYEALQRIYAGPIVVWGTLQLPFPSVEQWRKRLAEPREEIFGFAIEGTLVRFALRDGNYVDAYEMARLRT